MANNGPATNSSQFLLHTSLLMARR
jgi:cyclophilin family peptidyl-prolyl cis-trans isomerase